MQYLERFSLPSEATETEFILDHPMTGMTCYSNNIYPFRIFPWKQLRHMEFAPVTVFYGGNGSGKSTLLNLIAAALRMDRSADYNHTPFFEEYLKLCDYELHNDRPLPHGSRIITSDDVFDDLLHLRALNRGVDTNREALFDEYRAIRKEHYQLQSLQDYEELKYRNEAKKSTKSAFVRRRLPQNTFGQSNGESAYAYFTEQIKENALYLLDEPENSLSAKLQIELAHFLEESARFYGCQFIFSTHSPFLLSIPNAVIYDLDAVPVAKRRWVELENVRIYRDFFEQHQKEFEEI